VTSHVERYIITDASEELAASILRPKRSRKCQLFFIAQTPKTGGSKPIQNIRIYVSFNITT
jgi:hypothetical protein